jgi:hypothetical protein
MIHPPFSSSRGLDTNYFPDVSNNYCYINGSDVKKLTPTSIDTSADAEDNELYKNNKRKLDRLAGKDVDVIVPVLETNDNTPFEIVGPIRASRAPAGILSTQEYGQRVSNINFDSGSSGNVVAGPKIQDIVPQPSIPEIAEEPLPVEEVPVEEPPIEELPADEVPVENEKFIPNYYPQQRDMASRNGVIRGNLFDLCKDSFYELSQNIYSNVVAPVAGEPTSKEAFYYKGFSKCKGMSFGLAVVILVLSLFVIYKVFSLAFATFGNKQSDNVTYNVSPPIEDKNEEIKEVLINNDNDFTPPAVVENNEVTPEKSEPVNSEPVIPTETAMGGGYKYRMKRLVGSAF